MIVPPVVPCTRLAITFSRVVFPHPAGDAITLYHIGFFFQNRQQARQGQSVITEPTSSTDDAHNLATVYVQRDIF